MSKPLVWLGNISFAFYLVQYPVMVAMTRFVTGGHAFASLWWWLFFMLLCWAISIGLAGMIYHWVDLPIMNNFAKPKKKKPAPVAAPAKVDAPAA